LTNLVVFKHNLQPQIKKVFNYFIKKDVKCLNTIAEYVHKIKNSKNGSDPCGFRERDNFIARTCTDETILNVKTRRCVKKTGFIGKQILKDKQCMN
jgi:hypothetical protein